MGGTYIRTPEIRKKISESSLGRKHTLEARQKMSQKRQHANNPAWRGGGINYVRRQAKIRDDYTCQICGFRDPEIMQVDHVKPKYMFPELALTLSNHMTLCPNCHARKTVRETKERQTKCIN